MANAGAVSRGDRYEVCDRFTVGIHLATNPVGTSPGCAYLDRRSVVFAARSARKKVCRAGLGVFHSSVGDAHPARKNLLPRAGVRDAAGSWLRLDRIAIGSASRSVVAAG